MFVPDPIAPDMSPSVTYTDGFEPSRIKTGEYIVGSVRTGHEFFCDIYGWIGTISYMSQKNRPWGRFQVTLPIQALPDRSNGFR
jgi:hypothetical protein